jgi:leader peptidase (prepilin peptidase)/N-methyltransferase
MELIEETRVPILLLAFLMGLAVGSVATMLVYRGPTEEPMFKALFTCPECGRALAWRDRVAILSLLPGWRKVRTCGHRIRRRDAVVELVVALFWVLATARFGLSPVLPAFLAFLTTLVVLSAVDLEHRRILNRVLAPMTLVALLLLTAGAVAEGRPSVLVDSAKGALVYLVPMLALGLLIPESMGMGDIKLAGYLGLHLGWFSLAHVLFGAFLGFFIGAVIGVSLMIAGRKGRKETIPFGPSMAAGAAILVLIGAP